MLSSRPLVLLVVGLSASVALLAGCGKDSAVPSSTASPVVTASPSTSVTPTPSPSASTAAVKPSTNFDALSVTGAYGKAPKVSVKSPWGIDKTRTKVLQASNGAVVKEAQTVVVDYYGVDGRTGKKFDESFSRGQPVAFPLDQVVPGFSKGLVGQHQGSRVLIAMPGPDGYDASGGNEQAGIKVGDTLVFVVDLVGVQLPGPEGTAVAPKAGLPTVTDDKAGAPTITVPKTDPPTTLQVQPLIQGRGAKVKADDTVTINYRYVTWDTGKLVEDSYTSKAATTALSALLPGMVKGLTGQTVGSRVLLVIPPEQAYPAGNASPSIAPGQTLVMVVDLLLAHSGQ